MHRLGRRRTALGSQAVHRAPSGRRLPTSSPVRAIAARCGVQRPAKPVPKGRRSAWSQCCSNSRFVAPEARGDTSRGVSALRANPRNAHPHRIEPQRGDRSTPDSGFDHQRTPHAPSALSGRASRGRALRGFARSALTTRLVSSAPPAQPTALFKQYCGSFPLRLRRNEQRYSNSIAARFLCASGASNSAIQTVLTLAGA